MIVTTPNVHLLKKIDYPTLGLFTLITASTAIALPTFAYFYDYAWIDWAMFVGLYIFTGLGITVGYHRLIAHRSFNCPDWVKRIFLIAGGMALQNSALKWAAAHIRHHARCDQEEDPYNATKGFWYSHCGWLFIKDPYHDEKYASRLKHDPVVLWQHKYYVPIVLTGLAIPFLVGYFHNGWTGGASCFLLAGLGRTFFVLNSTFCINSVCHLWGDQPHGSQNSSRDSWWVSFLTFGEGYHNYHHMYQSDYRNGPRWYNFDPSKWLIWSLSKVGLAYDLRRQSPPHELRTR
ncbi:MAG: acyl-CoA desaturase [Nitrospirae bacterium]|nr:MAG: acyl-CoA desaturase [Nitrospirota bacterium]